MHKFHGRKLLKFTYRTSSAFCILVAATYGTCYLSLKNPKSQDWLQNRVNERLSARLSFEDIEFQWRGLYPGFLLKDVKVFAKEHLEPAIEIKQVQGFFDLSSFLIHRRPFVNNLTIIGTKLKFQTSDYLSYQLQDISEVKISLQSDDAKQWIKSFHVIESDVLIEHPKQTYHFTQTELSITPNETMTLNGHATYQDESGNPCFVNFVHHTQANNDEHQWNFTFYGNLEHLDKIVLSHQLLPSDHKQHNLKTQGNVHANVVLNQTKKQTSFYLHTNIKSMNLAFDASTLSADLFEGTVVGHKNQDAWQFATKELTFKNVLLNDAPVDDLTKVNLILDKQNIEEGEQWHLTAQSLPISFINEAKNIREKLQPQENHRFADLDLNLGQFDYIDLTVFKKDAEVKEIRNLKANFKNLSLNFKKQFELENLTGQVSYQEGEGKVKFDSKDLAITQTAWFDQPVLVDSLTGMVFVKKRQDKTTLSSIDTSVVIDNTKLHNAFEVVLPDYTKLDEEQSSSVSPVVDLTSHIENLPIAVVSANLPKGKLKPALYEWLTHALGKGYVKEGDIVFRGALNDFPFDKSQGVFQAHANVTQVDLKFSPHWPLLTGVDAELIFNNRSLIAKTSKASILGTSVDKIVARIEDVAASPAILTTDITAQANAEDALKIIDASPLEDKIGKSLHAYQIKGDMGLQLSLNIPLTKQQPKQIKVKGNIHTKNAKLTFAEQNVHIRDLIGDVSFTEHSVWAKKLKGKIGSEWSEFEFKSLLNEERKTQLHANGKMDFSQFISKDQMAIKEGLTGVSSYMASFNLYGEAGSQHGDFAVHSDLMGTQIDLPKPFFKSKHDSLPVLIEGKMTAEKINTYHIYFPQYQINLRFNNQNIHQPSLLAGHLNFDVNTPLLEPSNGTLAVTGELDSLDAKETFEFLKKCSQNTKQKQDIHPLLDLKVGEINLFGLPLKQTKIEGKYEEKLDNMLYSIQSDVLTGYISVPHNDKERVLVVDLDHLLIHELPEKTALNDNLFMRDDKRESVLNYPLEVKIKNLVFNEKRLSNLHLQLEPINFGYHIKNMNFNLGGAQVDTKGYWHYISGESQVDISGNLNTKNITSAMSALGLKGTLKEAKADVQFALSWAGYPFKLDIPSLSGELSFNLKDGLIQGVNPGFGRILSLLNLDNMRRRLNLDFSDVTKQGMVFDVLSGKMHLLEGVIHTDKVLLESPSVRIETTFRTSLTEQYLNGHMDVMPNLTGSLPIAAAIAAGNPAVGAAVWVMDKLFGRKIQEINRLEYRLSGTWETPNIQEMSVKTTRRDFGRE